MALFTPGPLIGGISGNLGGVNFAHGRHGSYIRTALKRTNKHSTLQYERRRAVQVAAQWWPTLAENDRGAWRHAASGMTHRNRLGQARRMSGYQLFCEVLMNHWPGWFVPEEIVGIILGRSPPPIFLSATFREAGPWNVTLQPLPIGLAILVKYYLARPVKSHPLRCYHNWFFRTTRTGAHNVRIYHPLADPDTRIDNTKAGEVIGLRMRMLHVLEEGFLMYSEPITTTVTVV